MPKVSVLMPVYNAANYIGEAIESILSQTFSDWELIIVNDGSTDNTEKKILLFTDKRIRYYKNEENKGVTFSRQLMVEKSLGEYIAFLDSDDIALPGKLKIQVDFLDNNPQYALCGTWGTIIDEEGRKIKNFNTSVEHDEIRCMLLFRNPFIQSSIMVRRALLSEETYDTDFPIAEDYDLWCRLSLAYKMRNIPKHLIKHRLHPASITAAKQKERNLFIKNIFKRELVNLAIYANDEELDIHLALKNKNAVDIPDKEFFKQLKPWLYKLGGANQLCRVYNHDTFLATVCFSWLYGCAKRKSYFRMLSLPVSLNAKAFRKFIQMVVRTKNSPRV